ncbi:MAG: DUF6261 family protein [Bacteroidales bacterium]|jgi:PAS domain-containing protein|nr:DUF6261 family protein [Bacteroidales bacterium]
MKRPIKRINAVALRNKTHLELMTELNGVLQQAQPLPEKVTAKLPSLVGLLADEKEAVAAIRKYEATEKLAQIDAARDNAFMGIAGLLRTSLRHFDEAVRNAAERLEIFFEAAGDVPRLSYDEETVAIDRLLQQLDGRKEDMAIVGMTQWVEELDKQNREMRELMSSRYEEEAGRSHLQMRAIRKEMDKLYTEILYLLEAAAALADDEPYKATIDALNARISRYAQILEQEKGRRKVNN